LNAGGRQQVRVVVDAKRCRLARGGFRSEDVLESLTHGQAADEPVDARIVRVRHIRQEGRKVDPKDLGHGVGVGGFRFR
jgi:hypothetical protein